MNDPLPKFEQVPPFTPKIIDLFVFTFFIINYCLHGFVLQISDGISHVVPKSNSIIIFRETTERHKI